MIRKILGLSVKTLTVDDKYSRLNRDNLTQPILRQSSKRQKNVSNFFSKFLKCQSNFEHFEKVDDTPMLCISKITDCEKRG